jgi:hypothetical protein
MDEIVSDVEKLFSAIWALVSVVWMMTFALAACALQLAIRILIQLFEWAAWPFACLYTYLKTYGASAKVEGKVNV